MMHIMWLKMWLLPLVLVHTTSVVVIAEWVQVAKLRPADLQAGDQFGYTVALDGATLVAKGERAAYVFTADDDTRAAWSEIQKLVPSIYNTSQFARSLSLSGSDLAVGAWKGGDAYTYEFAGGKFMENGAIDKTSLNTLAGVWPSTVIASWWGIRGKEASMVLVAESMCIAGRTVASGWRNKSVPSIKMHWATLLAEPGLVKHLHSRAT